MAFRLARTLLEAHGLAAAEPDRGRDALLPRIDQVLLGPGQAPLVAALLERAGVTAVRVRTVLAATTPRDGVETPAGPDWRRLARAQGMFVPRPGHGASEALHRERLAAPGRLALVAGEPPGCGAFGMLALPAGALEAAAVLAGGAFALRAPRAVGVALRGRPPRGAGGVDLALAVLARLGERGAAPDVVEFGGEGVAALPMAERLSAAWLLGQCGLPALFPSDETTRAALAALGREPDWRRLEAVGDGDERDLALDLGSLEPALAPVGGDGAGGATARPARPVREVEGEAVGRVVLGPAATLEDVARLAERLRGRGVAGGVECVVVAGSRALIDRLAATGLAAALAGAGVRVVEGEPPPGMLRAGDPASGPGTGLCFGLAFERVAGGRGTWLAGGVETLAEAALAGSLCVPGGGPEPGPLEPGAPAGAEPWLPRPDAGEAPPPRAAAPARAGTWRGEVLLALGDEVETVTVLGPGARLDEARGRLRAMAGALLAGIEPGFAERARRDSGGWLVAGNGFLRGGPRDAAAVCMAEAGIWGILARSYAPGAARALAHAGVVPFALRGEAPRRGDEVEVTGLPDSLRPGHPVAARDLTRGTHLGLAHDLSASEVEALRAGGLVAAAARSRPRGEEE